MTLTQEITYQWDHLCCNFDIGPPCCRFAPGTGECVNELKCYETVDHHLIENFQLIAITSLLHTIYLFIIFLLSALYCKLVDRFPRLFKESDGDRNGMELAENDGKRNDTAHTVSTKDEDIDYFKSA